MKMESKVDAGERVEPVEIEFGKGRVVLSDPIKAGVGSGCFRDLSVMNEAEFNFRLCSRSYGATGRRSRVSCAAQGIPFDRLRVSGL